MTIISDQEILDNISALKNYLKQEKIQVLHVSSFDPYMNEYVPLEDCIRYYLSGFTGSTAELLFFADREPMLFVDGRYHLQADQECQKLGIDVYHCQMNESNLRALTQVVKEGFPEDDLWIIPERTPLNYFNYFKQDKKVQEIGQDKVWSQFTRRIHRQIPEISQLKDEYVVENLSERIARVGLKEDQAMYLTALDDIAWISYLRGYQIDFSSTFYAKGLLFNDHLHLCIHTTTPIDHSIALDQESLTIHRDNRPLKVFENLCNLHGVKSVEIDSVSINVNDYEFWEKSAFKVIEGRCLMQIKSLKLPDEVEIYQDAFALSNNAIFNTINWLKEKVDQEEKISEKELNQQTTIFYQNEGSLSQSFKTISGASENGAIVHYSTPSATRVINRDDLILLDSGGYYDSGVATDTTRTFLSSHHCDEKKLKEYRYYYTLVLKSQINAESAVFKPGTSGKAIDYVARRPLYELGLDFNHGLGHGVGVLVHEDGIRLSSATDLPLKVGQIVSIEPGIYFDHKFGIRLENVVVVKPHETLKNLLCFKPLVWIPWEEKLIDRNLMSKNEIKYLDWYQEQSNQRLNIFK